MGAPRWPVLGMITAGALAIGSCTGAVMGHFTVTGGFSPRAGWEVPSFGTDEAVAALPPATASVRTVPKPSYAGYYPARAADVPDPALADAAARDFDALYDLPAEDDPVPEAAVHREPDPPAGDTVAYWEPIDTAD